MHEIYLIKHCDKDIQNPGDCCDTNGCIRSQKLVPYIKNLLGNKTPTRLIVPSDQHPPCKRSQRMIQTLTPLSAYYKLPITAKYCSIDAKSQAADLLNLSNELVICCWQHDELIELLKYLINMENPPNIPDYPKGRNDLVFKLTINDTIKLEIFLENLLPEDPKILPLEYQIFQENNLLFFEKITKNLCSGINLINYNYVNTNCSCN